MQMSTVDCKVPAVLEMFGETNEQLPNQTCGPMRLGWVQNIYNISLELTVKSLKEHNIIQLLSSAPF